MNIIWLSIFPTGGTQLEKIELTNKAIRINTDESIPLQVKLFPINANASIRIWSENEEIATVSSMGVVKAMSPGETVVHIDVISEGGSVYNEVCHIVVANSDKPSGINSIFAEKTFTKIYNISGQKLTNPIKGINVINGKKILIK